MTTEEQIDYMDERMRECTVLGTLYATRSAEAGSTASAVAGYIRAQRTGSLAVAGQCLGRIRTTLMDHQAACEEIVDDLDLRMRGLVSRDCRTEHMLVADRMVQAAMRFVRMAAEGGRYAGTTRQQ